MTWYPGALPRRTRYGQSDADRLGLTPIEDSSLEIIPWDGIKEAIARAHTTKSMPIYHQYNTWAPTGFKSNQDGLPYCWAWSATATMMDLRATEAKKTVMLSPVSLGWLVNWQERGYFLDETIQGMRERGIAPAEWTTGDFNGTSRNYRNYKDGWEKEAMLYKLNEVWDVDTERGDRYTIQQLVTLLCAGRPVYMAINSMSHAMMYTSIWWDETKQNNVVFGVRNSHDKPDVDHESGSKWVADELYGFASSVLA